MPFARGADGHRIHYVEHGSQGPALVLLQGIALDGRFWLDEPRRLAADPHQPWRVIVIDNRGVGRTGLPRRPWSMEDMADDVAAVLDDADVEHAVVVGYSMGGMIAQHVALRHRKRVSGLVLMATSAGFPHGVWPELDMLRTLVSMPLRRSGHTRTLARLVLPAHAHERAPELLGEWLGLMVEERPRKRGLLGQAGAVLGHSTGKRLAEIRVPTRVITGDCDTLVPPANSKVLTKHIPGAQLELLEGVGHGILLMDADALRRNLVHVRPHS